MRILLMVVLFLVVVGGLALVGYAVFFDLPAPQTDISVPVEPR
jgi:hypothetical protein